jgi:hypothetical protein
VVRKQDDTVSIEQVETIAAFHRLQFNLLGNSLEALFLPAAIIVVEGKTDVSYVERVLQIRFPNRKLAISSGQGDPKRVVAGLRNSLGGIEASPFRSRIFVVLDSVHQHGLEAELVEMGVPEENVITWEGNGIEYVYPPGLVARAFACSTDAVASMAIVDDRITLNGITKSPRRPL